MIITTNYEIPTTNASSVSFQDEDVWANLDLSEFNQEWLQDEADQSVAQDIDDFTCLFSTLEERQTVDDVSLQLALPQFTEKDLDDLLGAKIEMNDDEDEDDDDSYYSDEEMEEEDMEEDEIENKMMLTIENSSRTFFPSKPDFSFNAPIDLRCLIKTPLFQKLDSRVPVARIPKIDMCFAPTCSIVDSLNKPAAAVAAKKVEKKVAKKNKYVHNPNTCWVCKSGNSEDRKRALHKYLEKKTRRNWKRGARYTARSNVATSRVREGGRFVTKCRWI